MALATYSKTCTAHTPGNSTLYLCGANDVDVSSCVLASGVVTDFSVLVAGDCVSVDFDRDGLKTSFEGKSDSTGLKTVTQKIEVHLSKMSATLRSFVNNVLDQATCGLVALVYDANGVWWAYGLQHSGDVLNTTQQGMAVESANFDSGLKMDEEGMDKITLTMSGMFANIPLPCSGTVVAATGLGAATDIITTE